MSNAFILTVITPMQSFERDITYLRLGDSSGSFGIMKGHADFLSVLQPSLGYYKDASGTEIFFAVKGGVLRVSEGKTVLVTRDFFESRDAAELSTNIMNRAYDLSETEAVSAKMLDGLERMFIEKTLGFLR